MNYILNLDSLELQILNSCYFLKDMTEMTGTLFAVGFMLTSDAVRCFSLL